MPESARIALVGHCGPDSFALRSAITSMVPGSVVVFAADDQSARAEAARADLLLVNRMLDGDFASDSGVELVRTLAGARARLMLISNYASAQEEAVAAGAQPGFGKSNMHSPAARSAITHALALKPGDL